MSTITYRTATAADADALAQLRWELEEERHPDQAPTVDRAAYFARHREVVLEQMAHGDYFAWLAEADGVPVACVVLIWWARPPNFDQLERRRGMVTSVYTAPGVRRQGVAQRLMEMLLAFARERGVQRLILWASEMGQPLYEKIGFIHSRGFDFNF